MNSVPDKIPAAHSESEQQKENPSENAAANKTQKSNRRSLLFVIAIFVLPIILAKFALNGDWLAKGVTNKGTLLTEELTLTQLGINNSAYDKQWLILYSLPQSCDLGCQKIMETVHNTYVALGKEMPRVTPVALYQDDFSAEQLQHISQSKWQLLAMSAQAKQHINTPQIFIVDPLGNIFLSHQIPVNADQLPQFGKQILADMKKVLKYSKVG